MADKGGVGIDLNLDHVPMRETGMTAYEMLLSESQERMLMVLKPGGEAIAERISEKWELDFAVIGITTDTGRLVVRHGGKLEADSPLAALGNAAPQYQRPFTLRPKPAVIAPEDVPAPNSLLGALETMMGSPHLASRRWIWEQYDHMVMGDTIERPGGDAGIVRIHGTQKGLAISCDVTPRYCAADPKEGAKQAVAECWRNLTSVGADPLAITDCLNFGNPERPEIMGEFVGAVEGMAEACRALSFPVVSGNVSLYNEANGVAIPPTPAVGGVGLIPDIAKIARIGLTQEGDVLIMIGDEKGHLGQSLYQHLAQGKTEGAPPPVDLDAERHNGDFVRGLIRAGSVSAVHDISDGGLLVAIAEMALAGGMGAELDAPPQGLPAHAVWFGEDQGRYVLAAAPKDGAHILQQAAKAAIPARVVGKATGSALKLPGEAPLSLNALRSRHEGWLPGFMTGG
ncbi:MAG: AIR synthase-related protein, partial [Methyloceanibacter sp.]|nr:AIR synthase-related protein [Methyloceanibacter sp.]